jgi:hypothetical protein
MFLVKKLDRELVSQVGSVQKILSLESIESSQAVIQSCSIPNHRVPGKRMNQSCDVCVLYRALTLRCFCRECSKRRHVTAKQSGISVPWNGE